MKMIKGDPATDPKGLIADAYRINGITPPECRSVFLDWALSLPQDVETGAILRLLLERYGAGAPDHPMTSVLREGLETMTVAPRRRGGWRARLRN